MAEISFASAVENLKAKALAFSEIYSNFMRQEPFAALDAKTYENWKKTRATVDKIRASVKWITSVIDDASGFIGRTFGMNGVEGLNAIPLVPVAAIIAATAAVAYGISLMTDSINDIMDTRARYLTVDKINEQRAAQGLPPLSSNEVAQIVNKTSEFQTIAKWALIGAAIYYVAPIVMKKFEKRGLL